VQADGVHGPVHDEGGPGHVPAPLQEGNEKHHGEDDRHKHQHEPHAGYDAVVHQGNGPVRRTRRTQDRLSPALERTGCHPVNPVGKGRGQVEGKFEHDPHGHQKDGDAEEAVQDNAVDLLGHLHFPTFQLFQHLPGQSGRQGITHIRHERFHVVAMGLAQMDQGGVRGEVGRHAGGGTSLFVPFHELQQEPASRIPLRQPAVTLFQLFSQQLHRALHVLAVVKLVRLNPFRFIRNLHHRVQQGGQAALLNSGGGRHLDAEHHFHTRHIDAVSFRLRFVDDVERHHHRDAQLHELHRQVEIALQVGGVHHVDDQIGTLVDQVVAGDDLLLGIGGKRVGAWQVHQTDISAPMLEGRFFLLHRDTGPVTHMEPCARYGVDKCRFP